MIKLDKRSKAYRDACKTSAGEVVKIVVAKEGEGVTVLQEAHGLIYGDREVAYGHPKKNLNDIANFWQVYLERKYDIALPVDAEDVCQMMVLLKMVRGFNGPKKRDTIVDQAGYTGLLERLQK